MAVVYRAIPQVTVDMPTPVVVGGVPSAPRWAGPVAVSGTVTQGPTGVWVTGPPGPLIPLAGGGYATNPAKIAGIWGARWSVDDLPDPAHFPGGSYRLGAASARDGTASITPAARQWAADGGNPGAPAWASAYPFKPFVMPLNLAVGGGRTVRYDRAVVFNPHYIAHMWLDWAAPRRQPFTWLIYAILLDWPDPTWAHYLLDAGRDPYAAGLAGSFGPADCANYTPLGDKPGYRSLLMVTGNEIKMTANGDDDGSAGMAHAWIPPQVRPQMFIGGFSGDLSVVGAYSADRLVLRHGIIPTGPVEKHQQYVLGRRQGVLWSQRASAMAVFEVRYWDKLLPTDALYEQWRDLAWRHHGYAFTSWPAR